MADWIAFDDATVSVLTKRTRTEVQLGIGRALDVALAAEGPALAIFPADGGMAQLVTIRRIGQPPSVREPAIVTGFLGLTDAPPDREPQPAKKSWWQRIRSSQ